MVWEGLLLFSHVLIPKQPVSLLLMTDIFIFFKAKGKKWTKQDDSAIIIQKYARRHLAKKELEKKRKEKQDYDELMDKIQKEVGLFFS